MGDATLVLTETVHPRLWQVTRCRLTDSGGWFGKENLFVSRNNARLADCALEAGNVHHQYFVACRLGGGLLPGGVMRPSGVRTGEAIHTVRQRQ